MSSLQDGLFSQDEKSDPPTTTQPPRQRRSLIADVEKELREHGNPYVRVDEAKRALFAQTQLKAFHFVVYDKVGANWLLWCGEPNIAVGKEMDQWAETFGEGYRVVYAVRRKGGIVFRTSDGICLKLNGEAASTDQK
jgi:hypothetical protein